MGKQLVDNFAENLPGETKKSVHSSSVAKTENRFNSLWTDYKDPNVIRKLAGQIKQHTIDNLDHYLEKTEAKLKENGAEVYFARDGDSAKKIIFDILQKNNAKKVVKSKSMATEEIHLNEFLAEKGIEALETDLGEFILQIDNDHPSHIVTPIVHKNRRQVATSFEKNGLGAYNDEPEVITRRARAFLREKYLQADVGITGGNFISAESGRIALVTNEGNSRFSLAAPKIHIALIGIEKLLPHDRDFQIMLNLLGRSATGQQLTVYTEFIGGPKHPDQPDGPEQMHVVLLDNRRTEILAGNCREMLRCIRCGACLNVCPIYRQSSGHAYRSVYPGPMGAVLTPLFAGEKFAQFADLPKASSLCGACNEVCPVDIPIPDLLLKLRDRAKREGIKSPGTPPMGMWSLMATSPVAWKTALKASNVANSLPLDLIPVPALKDWTNSRTLPKFEGGSFRKWMKTRKGSK